ncbi:MAG: U32 family peptidase, partial [Desulfovibrio sp.]|nr:U32 family peptidase [Desulfovibrio sp.]
MSTEENLKNKPERKLPEILAPAGDSQCFLAAMAAGANAIYLGLKNFSARMEAENFSLTELSRLTALAHANKVKVYVAMNTMLKQEECAQAYRLLVRLADQVMADGLIVQDLS